MATCRRRGAVAGADRARRLCERRGSQGLRANHRQGGCGQAGRIRAAAPGRFPARADELARHIVALAERDTDIAIYLTVRQDPKRLSIYGLAHAVHCALVCLLMARRMGWDEDKVLTLVRRAGGGGAPRRQREHAAGREHHRSQRHAGGESIVRDTAKPEFAVVSAISDKGLVLRMTPERLYGLPE
jgi:hypothetical protein